MNAFLLALFGALCWGLAPLFGKVGLRGLNPLDGIVARTMITVLFIIGLAFASGFIHRVGTIPAKRWFLLAAEAFLATFAGDIAYYGAIKKGEIGQTAIIMAAAPLFTLWVGWYFLGEQLSPMKLVGAGLIIIGLILIGFKSWN
ncbi:MAG TPA: EamA family transporter [Bacillota bacterium]